MPHIEEVEVRASKSQVIAFFADPLRFAGIVGHISIAEMYDKEINNYLPMSQVKSPINKFKVIYFFGTPETKIYTNRGSMEGPIILPGGGIEYRGDSDDNKLIWKVTFLMDEKTRKLRIIIDAKQQFGFLDRLMGRDFKLEEHIAKEHIIPLLRIYLNSSSESTTITNSLNEVYRFKGDAREVLVKLRDVLNTVKYGGIIINGDSFNIISLISNGEIKRAKINNKEADSGEVLTYLLRAEGNVELIVYDVMIEEMIFESLRRKMIEVMS
ncbi:MAG: hypothetical protein QW214_08975 [Saccharolobus sp.]